MLVFDCAMMLLAEAASEDYSLARESLRGRLSHRGTTTSRACPQLGPDSP